MTLIQLRFQKCTLSLFPNLNVVSKVPLRGGLTIWKLAHCPRAQGQ
ncbi:unnamed protein product [Staurois parvus]|uniref:Uncharacterized protein n=1 Tax=Staurois parvus TaxID=386267 RepID=A0ABN9GWN7_9NEOB|nr:unnamed protein product [Staurois parvus]